jgi:hypothetical protein
MPNTIFFSWQADTKTRSGRNFIERALTRAASRISEDTEVEEAVREGLTVDRDTMGVAGSPPIVETIFRKIDQAAVFVPDLTFTGKRLDGRPTPNPNVLVEYGWALKSLGYGRIVPVMNIAHGDPIADAMPFNMRHLRNPIANHCPNDLDDAARREARDRLAKEIEAAVRAVFESEEFRDSLRKPPMPSAFARKNPIDSRGRFKPATEPIGLVDDFPHGVRELILAADPVCWFRLMPSLDPQQTWSVASIESTLKAKILFPLGRWSSLGFIRSEDGFGTYSVIERDRTVARAVLLAFTNGEMWTVDAYSLQACVREDQTKYIPNMETAFHSVLIAYGEFLLKLGIEPPFTWVAGMEELKGRNLYRPTQNGMMRVWPGPDGKGLVDIVAVSGIYTPSSAPGPTLKPFFSKLYESCGASRQD